MEVDMCRESGSVVMPGDVIFDITQNEEISRIVLGPGLRREADKVIVTKCGVIRHRTPNVYWIDTHQKKYIPARGEAVIGTVTSKGSEILKIDLGSPEPATLSLLSFSGATKRNKPIVQVGDVIFAKVLVASKDMEPELVCMDRYGKKGGLGVLKGPGFVFSIPLDVVRKVLSPRCPLLKLLGEKIPYEIAVGMNGRVWVCAKTSYHTMLICNCICLAEHMSKSQIAEMCQKITMYL